MTDTGASAMARPRVVVAALQDFYRRAFEAVELPPADAATVARVLIAADVRGIDSHGAPQAHGYARMIRRGLANPDRRSARSPRCRGRWSSTGTTAWVRWSGTTRCARRSRRRARSASAR